MIDLTSTLILIASGIIGTATAIALGWSESTEPLNPKKAVASLIRGSIAIIIYIAATYALTQTIGIWDYVEVAFFAAGFDTLIKRGQGVLQK